MALGDSSENIRSCCRMTAAELSLDMPVDRSDKGASTLGERFAGTEGNEIEDRTDAVLRREFIDKLFERDLTPRERQILALYYALEAGAQALTLEEIGLILAVTR